MTGQPTGGLFASPSVYEGRVYIGANTGVFYVLDLATKRVVWKRFLGFVPHNTCGKRGFTSTATVAPDASRGGQLTVYVAAADGYLYALRASDGSTVWRSPVGLPSSTKNDYYNWGSPAVANGKVYMGVTSQCDNPLVRGGVKGYDQASGSLLGTYFSVAPTRVGGGVWSSVAASSGGDIFATTGTNRFDDAESIVRMDGSTVAREEAWRIPDSEAILDSDFGASPTLFRATIGTTTTNLVGACNKNGLFYALRQQNLSAGPVWKFLAADPSAFGETACLAAAIWDGTRLFVAGSPTTISGTDYPGSIRQLNPATGAPIWQRGLNGIILGSPTMNGSGVIAAGTYNSGSPNAVYLLDSSDGRVLKTIGMGIYKVFGQPVFADNYLLISTLGGKGLMIYKP